MNQSESLDALSKKIFSPTSWLIPLMSILVSILLLGVYAWLEHMSVSWEMLVTALVASFTANGLWSSGKAVVNTMK